MAVGQFVDMRRSPQSRTPSRAREVAVGKRRSPMVLLRRAASRAVRAGRSHVRADIGDGAESRGGARIVRQDLPKPGQASEGGLREPDCAATAGREQESRQRMLCGRQTRAVSGSVEVSLRASAHIKCQAFGTACTCDVLASLASSAKRGRSFAQRTMDALQSAHGSVRFGGRAKRALRTSRGKSFGQGADNARKCRLHPADGADAESARTPYTSCRVCESRLCRHAAPAPQCLQHAEGNRPQRQR